MLAEIAHAGVALLGAQRIAGFPSVKFLSPMLPEQRCELVLTDKGGGTATFELTHEGRRVAIGQLRYQGPAQRSGHPDAAES